MLSTNGVVITALAWGGEQPVLRVWSGHEIIATHLLPGQPSAPCLVTDDRGRLSLWISIGDRVCVAERLKMPPVVFGNCEGSLQDAVALPGRRYVLAVLRGEALWLISPKPTDSVQVDEGAGRACLELDRNGVLHLAYEKQHGIEYRQFSNLDFRSPTRAERVAAPFGYHPALLAHGERVFLCYLGESWPQTDEDRTLWESQGHIRRLGLGGYIAALVLEDGKWNRHTLADSRQFAKPLWPKTPKFVYNYPTVGARTRLDEFSPPALCLGPDGVPQVFGANPARRWVSSSRFLGDKFSPAAEARGPLEQLTGPCLLPRFVPEGANGLPVVLVTKTRAYLDEVRLPPPQVQNGRRIDFVQPDELAVCRGLELKLNPMRRHPANPVMRVINEGMISATVFRERDGWRAEAQVKPDSIRWRRAYRIHSEDGIHWPRPEVIPDDTEVMIAGVTEKLAHRTVRYTEDPDEPNPAHRFKGFWLKPKAPWGTFVPVTSPDAEQWNVVAAAQPVMCDEDLYPWKDSSDVPERRFKATGCARSFCGRVCAQWTSADGMHWNDIRATLDWDNPFSSEPYLWEDFPNGGVGRILVEPWSGPDDEEEIHSGFVFRDGDRWLLHYMKWTPDGHVIPALASSRDGINFTRVAGGAPTLPLGEPGSWESGRIAIRNPPYLVDGVWRQHYTGSSWKHGFGGMGRRPHPSVPEAALASPMQLGLAEMAAGHWTHLQLSRECEIGELVTVALRIERPHALVIHVEGADQPGSSVVCSVLEANSRLPVHGFGFEECDPGSTFPVRWRGRGLEELGIRPIRIAVRLAGYRTRLFGLELKSAAK